jgi:YD repeat-containing protein
MNSSRLSFTQNRRRRLALKFDALDALERRNTITEPVSLAALSLGGWPAWLQGAVIPLTRDTNPLLERRLAAATAAPQSLVTRFSAGTTVPFSIVPRPVRATGGTDGPEPNSTLTWTRTARTETDWIGFRSESGSSVENSSLPPTKIGHGNPLKSGVPAAQAVGSGAGVLPELAARARGQVTSFRVQPFVDNQPTGPLVLPSGPTITPTSGPAKLWSYAATRAQIPAAPGAVATTTVATSGVHARLGAGNGNGGGMAGFGTQLAPGLTSLAGVDLTNAPWPVTGNSPTAVVGATGRPLAPAYTVYSLDYNDGTILFPNVYQYATLGSNEDLRAQVRDTTGPYTYTWNTSAISTLANSITTNGYQLTFQWNTPITGGPYTANVGLTVTNGSSQQVSQTYTFYVPNGSGTAGSGTRTWATSLPPDLVRAEAPQWSSQDVSVSSDSGALNTQIALPTYNPNVSPIVLQYDSLAADPRPIILIHHQLSPSLGALTKTSAQLTFGTTTGSTYYYDTSKFSPGDIAQLGLQANVPTLATDRYSYTATIVDNRSGTLTTTTYSGSSDLVSESASAFGAGWTLQGFERIKTNPTGGGGVILDLGAGSSLWFSGSPPSGGGNYTSPNGELSTLTKNADGTFTRTFTDNTKLNFDSSGNQTSFVDKEGLRTTYAYSSGLLSTITDPYNNVVTFTYSSGKLATIKDPAGRLATFTFSGSNMTAVWQNDGSQDVRTSFTYDSAARMTQYKDARSNVVTIAYDSASERVTTITRPDSSVETFKADQLRGFDTTGTSSSPANPTLLAEARGTYTDPLLNVTDTRPDWGGLGLTGLDDRRLGERRDV